MKTTKAEIRLQREDIQQMVAMLLEAQGHPLAGSVRDASVNITHHPGDQRDPDEWVVEIHWFGLDT